MKKLAESCAVNRIDVVIDTGGLHPFEGQMELLEAYARRLAPVQLGWLGCWGSAGGLFDGLLADEVSIPQDKTGLYDEAVFRLDGGQWCWDPPLAAPEPHRPPALSHGYVTYGVCVRSLRLSEACLDAFARIVAATPGSAIRFIGAVAEDWPLRRDILSRMHSQGVDAGRVFFDPFQPHAAYLEWFARIDVVLDALNGGGGLSLLDPLWMGVPVVTLAGEWLAPGKVHPFWQHSICSNGSVMTKPVFARLPCHLPETSPHWQNTVRPCGGASTSHRSWTVGALPRR